MNYFEYQSKQNHAHVPLPEDVIEFDHGIEVIEFKSWKEFSEHSKSHNRALDVRDFGAIPEEL